MIISVNSEFGTLIQKIEDSMLDYTDAEFKTLCDSVWNGAVSSDEA